MRTLKADTANKPFFVDNRNRTAENKVIVAYISQRSPRATMHTSAATVPHW